MSRMREIRPSGSEGGVGQSNAPSLPLSKDPNTKQRRRREAATVVGYAGPGFHTWPSGHIPQDTAPNPLLRIRPHAKKAFGEAFGAATGVSDPRLQKIRIRNNGAGGDAATDRGRDGALDCPTPPSEPDGRISRIRLTS